MDAEKLLNTSFDKPKPTNLIGNPNEKSEFTLYSNRSKENLPQNGDRFKAAVSGNNSKDDNEVPSFDSSFKAPAPKNSMTAEVARRENEGNNHQFNNVTDEQKEIYDISEKEGITAEHARIKAYAEQWKDVPEYKWTLGDIAKWKTNGGNDYIHQEKLGFIENYKDVILDASEKYDIPPILLAGVAYIEYGGDPMFADDIMHSIRTFDWSGPEWVDENLTITKNPDLTSFGNTSIQVRRALEMLGYDTSTTKRNAVIESLKDPIQNIYLAACHLDVLRNVDYKGKDAKDLTDDEIKIIASRYDLGPDIALNAIVTEYGEEIYENKEDILKAIFNNI